MRVTAIRRPCWRTGFVPSSRSGRRGGAGAVGAAARCPTPQYSAPPTSSSRPRAGRSSPTDLPRRLGPALGRPGAVLVDKEVAGSGGPKVGFEAHDPGRAVDPAAPRGERAVAERLSSYRGGASRERSTREATGK